MAAQGRAVAEGTLLMAGRVLSGVFVLAAMIALPAPAVAQEIPPAPRQADAASESLAAPSLSLDLHLRVRDTPADNGSSLTATWDAGRVSGELPPGDSLAPAAALTIERLVQGKEQFETAATAPISQEKFIDTGLERRPYSYRLTFSSATGAVFHTQATVPLIPKENFFRTDRVNALMVVLAMFLLVVAFIRAARRGISLYIRRIAGLDAIDEAVGRATEMGRKILYIPGDVSVGDPQTLASLGILGHVARLAARHGAKLEVPNIDPLTMEAARATVKQAYLEEGVPEAYDEGMVHFISANLFAYTAAVNGIMVRDRPAANFLLGRFAAEALLLAETGQGAGAIQIAGTANETQLPFFVAACDYTMLGEELYAASAHLSKDAQIVGSVKSQDVMKMVIIVAILLGVILATADVTGFAEWFASR